MSTFHKLILWLLLSTVNVGEANKDVTQQERGTRARAKTSTDVVDLSLSSVDTYAELKHDPTP